MGTMCSIKSLNLPEPLHFDLMNLLQDTLQNDTLQDRTHSWLQLFLVFLLVRLHGCNEVTNSALPRH